MNRAEQLLREYAEAFEAYEKAIPSDCIDWAERIESTHQRVKDASTATRHHVAELGVRNAMQKVNLAIRETKTSHHSIAEFLKDPAPIYAKMQSGEKVSLDDGAVIMYPGSLSDYGTRCSTCGDTFTHCKCCGEDIPDRPAPLRGGDMDVTSGCFGLRLVDGGAPNGIIELYIEDDELYHYKTSFNRVWLGSLITACGQMVKEAAE